VKEAIAVVNAQVVEEGVQTACSVPSATTEFMPSVRAWHSVYVEGEPAAVAIELRDRAGTPLAKHGTALLLRRVRTTQGTAEVEVVRQVLASDRKAGKAEMTFAPPAEGELYQDLPAPAQRRPRAHRPQVPGTLAPLRGARWSRRVSPPCRARILRSRRR
jgi:hypothetical protein